MPSILAKIWPTGRITWNRPKKVPLASLVGDGELTPSEEFETVEILCLHHGLQRFSQFNKKTHIYDGLVLAAEFTSPPVRKDSVALSSFGRSQLQEGAALMEQNYGLGRLAFDTYTFPSEYDCLHEGKKIASVMKNFLNSLAYHYEKNEIPFVWEYVIEIHPERSQKSGKSIPHVHLLRNSGVEKYVPIISKSLLTHLWSKAVRSVYWADWECPSFASSCRTEFVKKSVGAYLGKYLGKGEKKRDVQKNYSPLVLGQFWGRCRVLAKWVVFSCQRISHSWLPGILSFLGSSEFFRSFVIEIEGKNNPITVGGGFYPVGLDGRAVARRLKELVERKNQVSKKILDVFECILSFDLNRVLLINKAMQGCNFWALDEIPLEF